ncbi:hypothetical protein [Pseudomonas avellanae]|uniref:hypothetical protein n=1 Tax=Pseudomonas avellanae TaxID=46257 RepID=UPI003CC5524A
MSHAAQLVDLLLEAVQYTLLLLLAIEFELLLGVFKALFYVLIYVCQPLFQRLIVSLCMQYFAR